MVLSMLFYHGPEAGLQLPPQVRLERMGASLDHWKVVVFGILGRPAVNETSIISYGAIVLIVAAGLWVLWGYFTRGERWAYWVVMVMSAALVLLYGAPLLVPQARSFITWRNDTEAIFAVGAFAAVLLVLALPKTRRHFEFHLKNNPRARSTDIALR